MPIADPPSLPMPVKDTKEDQMDWEVDWEGPVNDGTGLKRKTSDQFPEKLMVLDVEMPSGEQVRALSPLSDQAIIVDDITDLTDLPSSPNTRAFKKPRTASSKASSSKPSSSKIPTSKPSTTATGNNTLKKQAATGKENVESSMEAKKSNVSGKMVGKGKGKATEADLLKLGVIVLNKKKRSLACEQMDLGAVVLSYTPYMTLLLQFHVYISAQTSSVTTIPEDYYPLIIMIAQESEKTTAREVAKLIKDRVMPARMDGDEGAELDIHGLIKVVEELMERVTYGIRPVDLPSLLPSLLPSIGPSTQTVSSEMDIKITNALRLGRWETKRMELVPQNVGPGKIGLGEVFSDRRKKREEAREALMQELGGWEEADVQDLLGVKQVEKEINRSNKREEDEIMFVDPAESPKKKARKIKEETEEQKTKRIAKEEKAKKKAEADEIKEEKARKKAEAEEKADKAKARSAMLLSSFLKKTPASTSVSASIGPSSAVGSSPVRGEREGERSLSRSSRSSSVQLSDFHSEIKPFFQGANVDVAPINHFAMCKVSQEARGRTLVRDRSKTITEIKETVSAEEELSKDELLRQAKETLSNLSFSSPKNLDDSFSMPRMSSRTRSGERLVASALPLPPPADVPGLKLKTKYPYYTVTQLILKANESGDGEEARRVYKAFEDKRLFWKKTLRFHEDSRPAYEGTWTKPSITVGPRTPFALDNAIDYSVDEGLEWEAEDPAEVDIASVLDEDEDMDDGDESDEMDDWMVGDDEIEFEEGAEGWAEAQEFKKGEQKPVVEDCYTEVGRAGAATKSQRFTRLVPFQKGPCMETRLGDVDPFMLKYRICLLNDTPMCGIDPFTFKSSSFEPVAKPPPTLQSVLIGNATKSGSSAPNPKQDSGKTCESAKLTFPVGTLAEFLKAIQGCEKNKEALLQDLFTQFKTVTTQKVIRNSLNLVADREKKGSGRWVVKNEAWNEAGVVLPK